MFFKIPILYLIGLIGRINSGVSINITFKFAKKATEIKKKPCGLHRKPELYDQHKFDDIS